MKAPRIFLITFFCLLGCCLRAGYVLLFRPNILVKQSARTLHIPKGITFVGLQTRLREEGYLRNQVSFGLLARLLKYDKRVLPGAYSLQPNMSNWQAIHLLRTGAQQPVKIVLHNAHDKRTLSKKITDHLAMNAEEFEPLLYDTDWLRRYGFNTENILTMFVPNTYEVYWNITPKGLFKRMHKEFKQFWGKARLDKARKLGLTPQEVTILASIVQKETNKADEAPVIAGVYINRLRKKIALQSCPTLLYILNDPSARRVLNKYKAIDSPYNTYKYRGLPPGPISMPTIAMIEAVLYFTSHNYLYFSAKEDFSGYHYFAKSFKEHSRNARRYQKTLNQLRIYR